MRAYSLSMVSYMNKSKTIKANKKALLEYLECVSKMLSSRIEGYILSHGTLFIGREPSKNVVVPSFKPKSKQCYYNSQMLASEENIQYIEGYAFDGLLPLGSYQANPRDFSRGIQP